MITIDIMCGSDITSACTEALEIFHNGGDPVSFDFNGQTVTTQEGDTVQTMYARWHDELERRRAEYEASDEYKAYQLERAEKERKAALATAKAEAAAPSEMSYKDKEAWDADYNANKNDGYGLACLTYAQRWARFMEVKINEGLAQGKTVRQVLEASASTCSHEADVEGITGFMYGCAVGCLSRAWLYGEDLRKWHNKEYGVSEDATGVVNPAIMTINVPDDSDGAQETAAAAAE